VKRRNRRVLIAWVLGADKYGGHLPMFPAEKYAARGE
jgi:hypothetical protein